MHVLLATSWLDPIVNVITTILNTINIPIHNLGWSLVIFALGFKLLFWPLNTKQFKAMIAMQQLAPRLKALQAKYGKSDPQRYQQETMELYKKNGVNPFAGCWPMLVQYPIIISVYYAVLNHRAMYENQHWLWIGSSITQHVPKIWGVGVLASSLAVGDLVLLVLYAVSMYFYSRYATMPSADPQQAQTQKMMALISPLMLGFLGLRYNWPSAMVLYWFAYNVFTMAQQFYLLGKYHQPLSVLDNEHAVTDIPDEPPAKAIAAKNGAPAGARNSSPKNASKKKKGAKR